MPKQELVVKNYKEPLKKIPKGEGFGYYGAVSMSVDGMKIQCHLCGEMFQHLGGHIWQTHKMKLSDFREKFQLSYSTPLVGDNYRQYLKERTLDWIKSLTPEEKEEYKRKSKEAMLLKKQIPHCKKMTLETTRGLS